MIRIEWHGLQASQSLFLLIVVATPIDRALYAMHVLSAHVHDCPCRVVCTCRQRSSTALVLVHVQLV